MKTIIFLAFIISIFSILSARETEFEKGIVPFIENQLKQFKSTLTLKRKLILSVIFIGQIIL